MSYRKAEWGNTPKITLATEWSKFTKSAISHMTESYTLTDENTMVWKPAKQKRLRCQYCGRIALTERSTCEGCGAVLPWEMSYEE